MAHKVGITNRYFGNFRDASMKNPKVRMVVGYGSPKDIKVLKDPSRIYPMTG